MQSKSISRNYTQTHAEIHFSDPKREQAIHKLGMTNNEIEQMIQLYRAKIAHDLCDSLFRVLEAVIDTKGKLSKQDMSDFQNFYNELKEFDV